jgi:hypothetical protein
LVVGLSKRRGLPTINGQSHILQWGEGIGAGVSVFQLDNQRAQPLYSAQ